MVLKRISRLRSINGVFNTFFYDMDIIVTVMLLKHTRNFNFASTFSFFPFFPFFLFVSIFFLQRIQFFFKIVLLVFFCLSSFRFLLMNIKQHFYSVDFIFLSFYHIFIMLFLLRSNFSWHTNTFVFTVDVKLECSFHVVRFPNFSKST